MKSWLQDNDIEIYTTNNEGKSVVAKRFIRPLKNKICRYMADVSKTCISINFLNQQKKTQFLFTEQST